MSGWKIRPIDADDYDLPLLYNGNPNLLSLKFHHGGMVKAGDGRSCYTGKRTYIDYVDCKTFSLLELITIIRELGYHEDSVKTFQFTRPFCSMELGGIDIRSDEDVKTLSKYTQGNCKFVNVIVEHYLDKLKSHMTKKTARKSVKLPSKKTAKRILEVDEIESDSDGNKGKQDSVHNVGNEENVRDGVHNVGVEDNVRDGVHNVGNEDNEDVFIDNDNLIENVEVDMRGYTFNVDAQMVDPNRWLNKQLDTELPDAELLVIDNDEFESASDSSAEEVERIKSKKLKELRKEHSSQSDHAPFYVTQTFGSTAEVKKLIRNYAVESRRYIKLVYNDQRRVRAICEGVVPVFGPDTQTIGPSEKQKETVGLNEKEKEAVGLNDKGKETVGPNDKCKRPVGPNESQNPKESFIESEKCPWTLHCSKMDGQKTWMIKTFKDIHTCLHSREIKHCTSTYMSKQIVDQIKGNPGIPTKALQQELEQKLQVSVSWMKVFRAKQQASIVINGDFTTQYSLLKDYCAELIKQNPGTTVRIQVEQPHNPNATTRQFKRIYICLGSLKQGWKACKRELVGLDGAFMKGPYPGQVLTVVGVDSNNGIYPIAYAIVEAETRDSWTWFLQCLGSDLELESHYNFTFISDRQKGLIQAVSTVFPSAEHRYCLKHIHENMKLKWRGRAYKDILWRCAIATTVSQFETHMQEMKNLNVDAYNWLAKIHPQHWSRSHFSGRCKSDMLLNNLVESLNKELVPAREKPIIACVDFIREYFMKRIVVVQKVIEKQKGPLTPAATRLMKVIEKDANDCQVIWNGGVKYQVAAPWGEQCVVDVQQMVCSCRKWELSGLPCKHVVAVNWDMCKHKMKVGIAESWAHKCYWLETWEHAYSFKVNPVTDATTWPKSGCTTTLTPPIHHNPVGRPKKKRVRGQYEDEPLVKGGKLARRVTEGKCGHCGKIVFEQCL